MNIFFLDVGQGTCNVLDFGDGSAIIVDCGQNYRVLKKLLHIRRINLIKLMVISHFDTDHWGAAPALLEDKTITIKKIAYHLDHKIRKTQFWTVLKKCTRQGVFTTKSDLLELTTDTKARRLWPLKNDKKEKVRNLEIKILSPTFDERNDASMSNDANAASGVLLLRTKNATIVLPGDAHIKQWREIRNRRGRPLKCDVIAVPHHGGAIWKGEVFDGDREQSELKKLYTNIVSAKHAIVSVGTDNNHGHPRKYVIKALRDAKTNIICTQMTPACSGGNLEDRRSSPVRNLLVNLPGASLPVVSRSSNQKNRNVACAGTISADLSGPDFLLERLDEHKHGVDRLQADFPLNPPLCR